MSSIPCPLRSYLKPARVKGARAFKRGRVLTWLLLGASGVTASLQGQPLAPAVTWHDLGEFAPVEGRAWTDTKAKFHRLPAHAEGKVRDNVWRLSQDSAGLRLRFVTDAEAIHVRWKVLRPDQKAMTHMPATGVSGLDLYVRDAGNWRWLAVGRPAEKGDDERVLVQGLNKESREYLLYLPLYNGLESVHIGLPAGAKLERAPDRYQSRRPIVFYGTSIVQGGCAARPGMAYPAILDRSLDWPTVNLGFSGNGRMEPEMAELLAELDPSVYVLDCLPNLDVEPAKERVEPFIRRLRQARPNTPIVLVENVHYPDAILNEARRLRTVGVNRHLREVIDRLRKAGDKNLHYVTSALLLGGDGEDTVDGSHPTDLGFVRMAAGMEPVLREALAGAGVTLPVEEGFVSLFDGETMSGWKRHEGMPPIHRGGKWWVEDGAIHGTQDPPGSGGLLWLDRPFMDYILKFEMQLTRPMDTGVFLRVGPTALSHQVCIDYHKDSDVGAIFIPFVGHRYVSNFADGGRLVTPGWNQFEVRIEGEPARIRVWLNSRLLTDFRHTAATTRGLPPRGGIAFQVHPDVESYQAWGPGNTLRVRHIRIKELPRTTSTAP